jgi:hypothetical protein
MPAIRPTAFLVTGFARAGKDTLAEAISEASGAKRLAYADELKDAANLLFERFGLHGKVDCRREGDKIRHRELLVAMGRALRSEDRDVFALPVARSAQYNLTAARSVVVSDWRYLNELGCMQEKLGPRPIVTIRISRFGLNAANQEEQDSIDLLSKQVQFTYAKMFKEGDIAGIREWAAEIVADQPALHAF